MKEKKEKPLKKISKAAVWTFCGIILSNLIGFFYRIPLVRILGANAYGLFCLGVSLLGFFRIVSLMGLKDGLVRTIAFYSSREDKTKMKTSIYSGFFISLISSFIIMIIILLFAPFIAIRIFHNNALILIFRLFAFSIPISVGIAIFIAIFRAFQKIRFMVLFEKITEKFFRMVLVLFFLVLGYSLYGAVAGFIIAGIITLILEIFAYRKISHLKNIHSADIFKTGKELLSLSLPLLYSGFIFVVTRYFDIFCLGFFCDAKSVGVYDATSNLALFLLIFSASLASLQLPIVSNLWEKKEINEIKKIYATITKWILILSIPFSIFCAVFAKDIISFIYGTPYIIGWKVFIIFLFGVILRSLTRPASQILTSMGKTRIQFKNMLIVTIVNIILNIILIPKFGIEGAAIATIISFSILSMLSVFWVHKLLKINPFFLNTLKIPISAIIVLPVFFLKIYLHVHFLLAFCLTGIVYLISYYIILSLFGEVKQENIYFRKLIIGFIMRQRNK